MNQKQKDRVNQSLYYDEKGDKHFIAEIEMKCYDKNGNLLCGNFLSKETAELNDLFTLKEKIHFMEDLINTEAAVNKGG